MTRKGKADIIFTLLYTRFFCRTRLFCRYWGRNMKKNGALCLILILLLMILCCPVAVGAQETQPEQTDTPVISVNSCHSLDANMALLGSAQLVDNAKAAVLFEANSETLMYAWNADSQMYPASLVKILTALIAVEKGDLSDTLIVSESAVSSVPYDAVSAELQPGEQLALEDLLYCLLVGSANDAAVVIAEHISGSHGAFVQEMNAYAQALGCTGTNFTNAHGLHDEAQYTTARDIAKILYEALQNDTFRTIFTTNKYSVSATNKSEERSLSSGNSLLDTSSKLYYDARVIGGRTGVTGDGRRCLAAAAESNGMQLISIVMGAESVYQEDGYSAVSVGGYHETTALLDAGFNGYKSAQVLYANQALKQYTVENGDCDVIVGPKISVSTILPEKASSAELSFRFTDASLSAPVEPDQKVSDVEVWHGNMCVAQAELFAMNAVRLANVPSEDNLVQKRYTDPILVLWITLALIAGAVLTVVALRLTGRIRMLILKKRSKRYRRDRRRSR